MYYGVKNNHYRGRTPTKQGQFLETLTALAIFFVFLPKYGQVIFFLRKKCRDLLLRVNFTKIHYYSGRKWHKKGCLAQSSTIVDGAANIGQELNHGDDEK